MLMIRWNISVLLMAHRGLDRAQIESLFLILFNNVWHDDDLCRAHLVAGRGIHQAKCRLSHVEGTQSSRSGRIRR